MRTGTINGVPYSVPEGYEVIDCDYLKRLMAFTAIVSDLDRSAVGRHLGDAESQDPTGTSQGNPILPVGMHIGYTINGDHIVVPPRDVRHDPSAWIQRRPE